MSLSLPSSQPYGSLPGPPPVTPDASLDVSRFLRIFTSRIPLIAAVVVLCLGAAAYYLVKTPKMYASYATLQVSLYTAPLLKGTDEVPGDRDSLEALYTFEQSLTNRSLLLAVGRELKLDQDPRLIAPSEDGSPPTDSQVAKALAPLVHAELRRGTRLVDISTKYFDAETAKKLADSLIALYIQQGESAESSSSSSNMDYLKNEAERLKAKLTDSDRALQQFKEANAGIPLESGYNLGLDRLKEMNAQLTIAKGQRIKLEAEIAKLDALSTGDPAMLLQIASISTQPQIVELQRLLSSKEVEFSALQQRYLYKHPKFIQARQELDNLLAARDSALKGAAERLHTSYDSALASEGRLQQAISEQDKLALNVSKLANPLTQLQNEVTADRALYESVLNRLKELNVAAGVSMTNFRVSEAPMVENDAISPKKKQTLALALVAGMMLGLGSALGMEFLRPTPKAGAASEQGLGVPVLAELPGGHSKDLSATLGSMRLVGSAQYEGFRELRASLRKLRADREPRSVAITSPDDDGGKSYCALNLAAAFANDGLRTLLIEVDFNDPVMAEALLEERELPALGLSDGLTSNLSPTAFCHHTSVNNLYLIPAGNNLVGAQSLLSGIAFQNLMLLAWNSFDRIVLDAPSVPLMMEPLAPVRFAEAVCVVVKKGHATPQELTPSLDKLRFPGHAPTGLIVNHDHYDVIDPLEKPQGFSLSGLLTSSRAA